MPLPVDRYDMSQYYSLKSLLERILGKRVYAEIKESRSLPAWRRQALRVLKASRLAIEETVQVCDAAWRDDVIIVLSHGEDTIKAATSIEDIIAAMASTYVELSFLQIGLVPEHRMSQAVRLRRAEWKLDTFRSPQYVQSTKQRQAYEWSRIQREVGVQRSLELHREWRAAGVVVSFSEWFHAREELTPSLADESGGESAASAS